MTYYLNRQQGVASDLLDWPPLRVYSKGIRTQLLPVAELVYLESDKNYTWLRWSDGLRVMVPYTLKRLQDRLPPDWFIRLNRQFVVNRHFVQRVEEEVAGARVYLNTGLSFPVSRRRWVELRKQMSPNKDLIYELQPS
jgi:DNA-binding LytR/AlgR family response regulator